MKTLKILAVLLLITLQVNGQNAVIDAIGYVPPIEKPKPITHKDTLVLYPNLSIRENLNRIDSVMAMHRNDEGVSCLVSIYGKYPVHSMLSHNEYIGRIDAKELQQYANAIASLEACFEGAKDKKEKAYYKAKIDKGNRYLNSYNEMEVKGRILLKLYTQSFTIFPGFYRDNYTHITDENGGRCLQDIRYIEVEGSGGWRNWYYFYTLTAGELYGKIRDMIKNELGIEEKQYIASTPQKEKKNITAQYQF